MKVNLKIGTLTAAAGALAIAVPAAAHPGSGSHPTQVGTHGKSHHCLPHNVAYNEGGTVDAKTPSTLAKDAAGTWSGTLVVDVTSTNRAAKADKKTTVTYTFDHAKLRVRFAGGAAGFDANDRVALLGKLAVVARKCPALSPAAAPVFRMVVVHPAAPTTPPGTPPSKP